MRGHQLGAQRPTASGRIRRDKAQTKPAGRHDPLTVQMRRKEERLQKFPKVSKTLELDAHPSSSIARHWLSRMMCSFIE